MVIEVVTLTVTLFSITSFLSTQPSSLATPLPQESDLSFTQKISEYVPPTLTLTPSPSPRISPKEALPTQIVENKNTDTEITPTSSPLITAIPTPSQEVTPTPTIPAPTEIDSFFDKYSAEYNIDKELLKKIARCESGFNPVAENGEYKGMFQFASSSWSSARSQLGMDPNPDLRTNAEEAIRTASFMISKGQQNAWRNCL